MQLYQKNLWAPLFIQKYFSDVNANVQNYATILKRRGKIVSYIIESKSLSTYVRTHGVTIVHISH